jgi:large subunit ribosomal protein L16
MATSSKMINGKGDIEGYVAVVKPGTILFEIGGVDRELSKEALRLASHKLSVKTKFVERKEM